MEDNKYICPKCGTEMDAVYEKPALNLSCPKCGCKIATEKWDDIDLDDNDYEIILIPSDSFPIEAIKLISNITGLNFIAAKDLLRCGGTVLKAKATIIKEKCSLLDDAHIVYLISPDFPY